MRRGPEADLLRSGLEILSFTLPGIPGHPRKRSDSVREVRIPVLSAPYSSYSLSPRASLTAAVTACSSVRFVGECAAR